MSDYTKICVNMPKSTKMAFFLHVPILIPCLVECVVTYFNEVYNLKEHRGCFFEQTKLDFGSWKYLFFVLD